MISDIIDAYEFPEIANKFYVTAVPAVILSADKPYGGEVLAIGLPEEKILIERIVELGVAD